MRKVMATEPSKVLKLKSKLNTYNTPSLNYLREENQMSTTAASYYRAQLVKFNHELSQLRIELKHSTDNKTDDEIETQIAYKQREIQSIKELLANELLAS